MKQPTCTILGGTNGSGKSSLYDRIKPPGQFINADIIAKKIDPARPESASVAAGKQVLRDLDRLVHARRDFVYETTLSGRQPLQLMKTAKGRGYRIALVFIVLERIPGGQIHMWDSRFALFLIQAFCWLEEAAMNDEAFVDGCSRAASRRC